MEITIIDINIRQSTYTKISNSNRKYLNRLKIEYFNAKQPVYRSTYVRRMAKNLWMNSISVIYSESLFYFRMLSECDVSLFFTNSPLNSSKAESFEY